MSMHACSALIFTQMSIYSQPFLSPPVQWASTSTGQVTCVWTLRPCFWRSKLVQTFSNGWYWLIAALYQVTEVCQSGLDSAASWLCLKPQLLCGSRQKQVNRTSKKLCSEPVWIDFQYCMELCQLVLYTEFSINKNNNLPFVSKSRGG